MTMQSIQGTKIPYLMQFPSGKWGFVGAVPLKLAFVHRDGTEVSEDEGRKVASFGRGLFQNVSTKTWETAQAALHAAEALGYHAESLEAAQRQGLAMLGAPL